MNSTANREWNNLFAIFSWEKENARLELGILDRIVLQEPASHKVHSRLAIAKGAICVREPDTKISFIERAVICQPLILIECCFNVRIGKFDCASCTFLCPIWRVAEHVRRENPFQRERRSPAAVTCADHLTGLDACSLKLLYYILEFRPGLGNFHANLFE